MATGRCEFDKAILTAGVHLQAPDGRVGANRWRPVEPQALSAYISIAPLIAGHPRGAPCATESQFAANREKRAKSGSDANLFITLRPTCPLKTAKSQIAGEIGVSEVTLKILRGNIMRKMQAKSLAELVLMADTLKIQSDKTYRTLLHDANI